MTNSEMLRPEALTEVLKHVSEGYCYDICANCDECPSFISEHCKAKEDSDALQMYAGRYTFDRLSDGTLFIQLEEKK